MISPRALVEEVSNYLVDQDPDFPFEHWTEDDLLHYFRLAVEIVANAQREKFIKRTSMPLVAGSLQTVPEACHDVSSVLGQADSKGRVKSFPRQTSKNALHLVGKIGCKDCHAEASSSDYTMDSWSYDPNDNNILYVDPPVPDGVTGTLELMCFSPPKIDSIDSDVDLGSQLRPVIFELMLYYAWGVDTESVPSRDRSAVHWNNAFTLLGMEAKQASNRYAVTRVPELRIGAKK